MAANKFATMLQKNCHKITVILVYAVLEWILILLLLLNSLFSHLITKFTTFFHLKPSCIWCSTTPKNTHFDHVCEAHATQTSNMTYCSAHNKLTEAKFLCAHCSSPSSPHDGQSTVAFFALVGGQISSDDRCSCCDQMICQKYMGVGVKPPSLDVIVEYLCKKKMGFRDEFEEKLVGEECVSVEEWDSSNDPLSNSGCNEDDESVYISDMLLQNAELMDSDRFICIELNSDKPPTNSLEAVEGSELDDDQNDDVENLAASKKEIDAEEVEEEDNLSGASEIEGGVETLRATIKTQEKTLMALYTELEEERRAAAEAAKQTMAMITKLQEDKATIQMEAAQYQRMMEEQAEYDQEALQLLNDLMLKREKEKKELEKELQTYRLNASSHTKNNNHDDENEDEDEEDDKLAEFEEERVSILEQVKVLEGTVKKLLPLFDLAETEDCDKGMVMSNKILIEKELGHVYERLQALEADKDFLKHCKRSMMKGNQEMGLLQEIMQHLRDLKCVKFLERNGVDVSLQDELTEEED